MGRHRPCLQMQRLVHRHRQPAACASTSTTVPRRRPGWPGSTRRGVVQAAGANLRALRAGDEVLGFCRGALSEYPCAAADLVMPKPPSLTFEEAAAVPVAAATAQRGICDVGQVTAGQRVLVYGANGGVGTFAVQVAAALGDEVTAVCRS